MRYQLVAGVNAASPMNTFRVEANLISLRRVYPFKTNFRRADSKRVAIDDPRHTRPVAACVSEQVSQVTNAMTIVFIV